MGKWTLRAFTILCLLSFILSGCSYFTVKREMRNVEGLLAELKAAGGDKLVPYEYCSAESFLQVTKLEFAESDYPTAKKFVLRAKAAAEAGLAQVKKR